MERLVIYCKSFKGDFDRVKIMLDSIKNYNTDRIPFFVSVPKEDIALFKTLDGANIISDEEILATIASQGWIQQQLVKSNFWRLGISKNYICIDSDSYFIRPFSIKDFMYNEETPYTVMHEQKELFSWSVNKVSQLGFDPKHSFLESRKSIMDIFQRTNRYYDFGPSPTIWSADVWRSLDDEYTKANGLTFAQLIEHTPSEFGWYGEALLAFRAIEIMPIEPLFKVFHYPQQYLEYKQQGVTEEMIAQNYMGVVMQSNFNAPLKY